MHKLQVATRQNTFCDSVILVLLVVLLHRLRHEVGEERAPVVGRDGREERHRQNHLLQGSINKTCSQL